MEAVIAEATASRVFQVSYHRDFKPWRLAYSGPCGVARSFAAADWPVIAGDFADPTQVLQHTCDTGGASSGSPLLLETGEGTAVVGVNVGTYVQSTMLMEDGRITKRLEAAEVANTAVNSDAFAGKLKIFREAAILTSPEEIRALQMALKLRALYPGTIDGAYGAGLRAAIEAYEGAQNLPVTGLATKALLQRCTAGRCNTPRLRTSRGRVARALQQLGEALLLARAQGLGRRLGGGGPTRAGAPEDAHSRGGQQQQRGKPKQQGVGIELGAQQHEFAVARLHEGQHGRVAVPRP